ncbi:MAG: hypothetical protein LBH98_00650 [Chitinispirillales bacterium]|jgi:hypothetical protein|nr:hypothetical protein [Chitinispirillales bacterium]
MSALTFDNIDKINGLRTDLLKEKEKLSWLNHITKNGNEKYDMRIDAGTDDFYIKADLRPAIVETEESIKEIVKKLFDLGVKL